SRRCRRADIHDGTFHDAREQLARRDNDVLAYPVGSSSGTSPVLNRTTASANSPMSGSPVRENATAPAFEAASARAREIACVEDWDSIGSRAIRSPSSVFLKAIAT